MNAITPFQPQPVAPTFTMSEMERVALAIAKGGLFGSSDPNAVLTLCMVAQAEGKHPGLVMQQYHIISGKPAKKAEAMLVDFLASGGKVEWHALTDDCVDATFTHPAGGSARISWDKARVAQAQLGGNAMHKKYPRQMLRSRVVSEGVRTVFPGATSGMYVPEEVMDFDDGPKSGPKMPPAQRARDIKADRPALTNERSPGREKAEEWLHGHVEAVESAASADDLDAIIGAGRKAIAKLEREHPDLHAIGVAAETRRGRYFVEQQAGPAVAGVAALLDGAADAIIAEINLRTTVVDVNGYVSGQRDTILALSDDDRERIALAQEARFNEIKGPNYHGAAQ